MKNNPLTNVLLVVLAATAVASVVLCMMFANNRRELGRLQSRAEQLALQKQWFESLVGETAEYGKTHPAIDPILEMIGYHRNAQPGGAAPATTPPAGAAATAPRSNPK